MKKDEKVGTGSSSEEAEKVKAAVGKSDARELPPLNESESKKNKNSQSENIRKLIHGLKAILIVLVLLALAMWAISWVAGALGPSKKESDQDGLESVVEADSQIDQVNLNSFNPLLAESAENLIPIEVEEVTFIEDEVNLNALVEELNGTQDEVLKISAQLSKMAGVAEQFSSVESKVFNLASELASEKEAEMERIAELEKNMVYLMKEVKRLKWVERQKRVSRKKVASSSFKVKSFFIWQYRPGVEIESKGVSGRFYEGDLLDGMRLLNIDVNKEQVTFTKNGKKVVMTLEEV